jgi:Do/DeqQ family serine protease
MATLGLAVMAAPFELDDKPIARDDGRFSGYAAVVKQVRPAVVSVFPQKVLAAGETNREDLMRRYFRRPPAEGEEGGEKKEEQGAGSGVIVSADGLVLTNHHVVSVGGDKPADELMVELADRRRFKAELIGSDPLTDLALLRIPGKDFPHLQLADSRKVEVGDVVFAAGNPFKVGLTVTMGIVSAVDRADLNVLQKNAYELFIQTDAPINPGNSGGALVDLEGRLVGINTAIIGTAGGSVGIGFAVPTRLVRRVSMPLLETGRIERAFLGAAVGDVTPELAKEAGLPMIAGVVIEDVGADLPAARAGLRKGDVVTAVDGEPVSTRGAFRTLVAYSEIGKATKFELYRDGNKEVLGVILGSRDAPDAVAAKRAEPVELLPGLWVEPLNDALREERQWPDEVEGMVIREAKEGGLPGDLKAGEVIVEINNKAASGLEIKSLLRIGVNKLKLFTGERYRHTILRVD